MASAAAVGTMPESGIGADLPARCAAATTISASIAANIDGATIDLCATRISQSSSTECNDDISAPFFAACRNRCASNG